MNKREATIIGAFTGTLIGDFSELHTYIEEKLGYPVMTHELGFPETWEKIKEAVRDDFLVLCNSLTD